MKPYAIAGVAFILGFLAATFQDSTTAQDLSDAKDGATNAAPAKPIVTAPEQPRSQTCVVPDTDLVNGMLDETPGWLLSNLISGLTLLDEDDLSNVFDTAKFAKRAYALVTQAVTQDTGASGAVQLSFSSQAAALSPQTEFDAGRKKIYSTVDLSAYTGSHVFSMWARADEADVFLFDRFAVNRGSSVSSFWYEQDWQPGRYRVELLSDDDQLEPIAQGEFVVVEAEPDV